MQHALAHAGAGEQAHALASADRQQAVDGAHAGVQHRVDGRARQRVDRLGRQRRQLGAGQRAQPVQRTAGAVQHAPEQGIAHGQVAAQLGLGVAVQLGLAGQRNLALHGRLAGHHAGAGRQAGNIGLRHQVQGVAVEAHDLGVGPVVMPARDLDAGGGAHRQAQAGGVQHQARGAGDAAADHPGLGRGGADRADLQLGLPAVDHRTAGRALMASPLSPGPVLPRKCCGSEAATRRQRVCSVASMSP